MGAALALGATPGRAEPRPLRLDYQAVEGCPDAETFLEEIRWRTSLARPALPGEEALDVAARVEHRGGTSVGRILLGHGAEQVQREVGSEHCGEVVSALALITALAIDPRARTMPRPRPPPPPDLPPLPDAPASDGPEAPRPRERSRRGAATTTGLIDDPLLGPPEVAPAPARWLLGARLTAAFGIAPRPLLGGGIVAERELSQRWGASLRLAVELGGTGAFDVGPGGASFLRGLGRFEGCAFAWRPVSRLMLVPCVGVEAGAIHAAGTVRGTIVEAQQVTVPWVGAGLLPRFVVALGRFTIEAQGGPVFPAVRRTFSFESPAYVIDVLPPVTWTVGIGAGVRFP